MGDLEQDSILWIKTSHHDLDILGYRRATKINTKRDEERKRSKTKKIYYVRIII